MMLDAVLYIDVSCYACGRLVALSNAIQWDGRNYCREWCAPPAYTDAIRDIAKEAK